MRGVEIERHLIKLGHFGIEVAAEVEIPKSEGVIRIGAFVDGDGQL